MKTKKIITIALCASALLLVGCNGETKVANPSLDTFAKCVTAASAKMYGADTCPHCQNQKELLGDSFQYINYIDCNKSPTECSAAAIEKIPTWEFKDGTKEVGEKTLAELATKTSCSLSE